MSDTKIRHYMALLSSPGHLQETVSLKPDMWIDITDKPSYRELESSLRDLEVLCEVRGSRIESLECEIDELEDKLEAQPQQVAGEQLERAIEYFCDVTGKDRTVGWEVIIEDTLRAALGGDESE